VSRRKPQKGRKGQATQLPKVPRKHNKVTTVGASAVERRSRTPLIHLQFYLELPFDAGLSQGSFNAIELAHPPIEDWAGFDLQAFLGMPELPKPAVRPCVVLRFRRVLKPATSPFGNVQSAFPEDLAPVFRGDHDVEAPTTSVTIVKAERIVPSPTGDFDERWLRQQFGVVLGKLNNQLLALGAAAGDHRIHPVHEADLPPLILGWQQDLRDLDDADKPPRLFLLFLHWGRERVSTDHDATVINRAMAISEHLGHGPFSQAMEFLYAARRSLETGRAAHAVLEAGTAVELLVDGVVRGVGMASKWTDDKLENVLLRTPFRSRYEDHFARALGVSVGESRPASDPVNAWLEGGYDLRNRVAHLGHRPSDAEAGDALIQAYALLDFVADRAEDDPALGITFPNIETLVPHPELDERSLAPDGPPSEGRLAREAFAAGLNAFEKGEIGTATEHFTEASRHGSSRGAFNVGLARWRSGDVDGASEWIQLATDRGHAGARAYLGMLMLAEDRRDDAEELLRGVVPGPHSRGWPLAAFFLATILECRDECEQAAALYRDAAVVADFALGPYAAFRRGVLLRDLGDPAAIDSWTLAVELGSARAAVALADFFRSEHDPDRAIAMLRRAVKLDGDPLDDGVDIGYGLRMQLGDGTPPTVPEEIARSLILVARELGELGRGDEAVRLLDEVVELYDDAPAPVLQVAVASALVSKSACLGRLGRQSEVLDVSRAIVARFGTSQEANIQSEVRAARLNKATALLELGRHEEALAAYDEALPPANDMIDAACRDQIMQGLVNRAAALVGLGRLEDAVVASDHAVTQLAEDGGELGVDLVVAALTNKATALVALGRWEDTLSVCQRLKVRLARATEPETPDRLAFTLFYKAVALGELGRRDEAILSYNGVVARAAESDRPQVRQYVATSLVHKGILAAELGRLSDAIAADDDVIARFEDDPDPLIRELVARALVNNAVNLTTIERADEAVAIDDDVVARFPDAEVQVARALANKTAALATLRRDLEALAACDSVVARFPNASDPKIREAIANALLNKGGAAQKLERTNEAAAAYEQVVERFSDDSGSVLNDRVARAHAALAALRPPT
jgi:tetratricopeptide (TPR) repeat protein